MRRYRKRAEETGSTLVETIIAIAILGILGAAILASVATLTSAGDRSRRSMRVATAAQSAADTISSRMTPYIACSPAASYAAAVSALGTAVVPADITVTVSATVGYFDGTGFQPSCPSTLAGDARRSQQIMVTATTERAIRSVTFVKREP